MLIDAAGGDETFYNSAKAIVAEIYGKDAIATLDERATVFNLPKLADGVLRYTNKPGAGETAIRFLAKTERRLNGKTPAGVLQGVTVDGRTAIFLSREDISCEGLLGYCGCDVDGYDPGEGASGTAYRLMRNILISAALPDFKP